MFSQTGAMSLAFQMISNGDVIDAIRRLADKAVSHPVPTCSEGASQQCRGVLGGTVTVQLVNTVTTSTGVI
jgi:hypothetical protein